MIFVTHSLQLEVEIVRFFDIFRDEKKLMPESQNMIGDPIYISGRQQELEVCQVMGLELAPEVHGCDAFDGELGVEIKSSISNPPGFEFQFGVSPTEKEQREHILKKVDEWDYILCAFFDRNLAHGKDKPIRWIVRVEVKDFLAGHLERCMDYWRRGQVIHRSDNKTRTSLTKTWLREHGTVVYEVEPGEFIHTMFSGKRGVAMNKMNWTPSAIGKLKAEMEICSDESKSAAFRIISENSKTIFGQTISKDAVDKAYYKYIVGKGKRTQRIAAKLAPSGLGIDARIVIAGKLLDTDRDFAWAILRFLNGD